MSLRFRRSKGCRWTIWLVTWTANCHLTGCAEVVGLQTQIFPGSCFSFFRTGCIQTFLVQIHSYVLILPRVLQQLTMDEFRDLISLPLFTVIILPFTPITEKGRGSNAGVRTSALLCFKRTWSPTTIRLALSRAFRLLSAYSFICFFLAASLCLIGSYGISPAGTILSGSFLRSSLPNMSMSGLSFVAGWGVAR